MSDGAGLGIETLDALLARTRRALEAASSFGPQGGAGAGTAEAGPDAEPIGLRGEGEAADGLIRVTVSPNRLVSLRINPEAAGLPVARLAEEITTAVNAGFEQLRREAGTADAVRDAQTFATGLSAELKDLQNESMRSMAAIGQALEDVLARMRGPR
ncbi:MAG: YbaB/EbfC family nucleoid-associated protein [Micromonosporaceae bacterium]|nr:YbaB/EbfC family nucleoid-associated protein [Micromonosporaceae bacterium]